jgi:alpha,alpha-trehalase
MDKRDLFFIEDLGPLYADVQRSGLLEDSKTFPDSLPLHPVSVITAAYAVAKHLPGFDLLAFVKKHFKLPDQQEPDYDSAQKPIRNHLEELWAVLTRTPDQAGGTLIPLPHPYIVPGGRFREIYYWDSYFTMLGLQATGRIDIMRNMVDNFAWLIDNFGFIPNGNRTYYLGRSQPPYFALMVGLLADVAGKQFLLQYRTQMKREYEFWMDGAENLSEETPSNRRVVRLSDGSVLNRYWDDNPSPRPEAFMEDEDVAQNAGGDPLCIFRHIRAAAESGWDFSSRWQRDPRDMGTYTCRNGGCMWG